MRRELSSGFSWLIAISIALLIIAGITVVYQWQVVSTDSQTRLAAQLRIECDVLIRLLPADLKLQPGRISDDRRLTIIRVDGVVLFDSEADATKMDNHNHRPEVELARRDGFGWSRRFSDTTKIDYLYAGRLLPDGRVFRLAAPLQVEERFVNRLAFPPILATALVIMGGGLALLVYSWRSRERVSELIDVSRAFGAGDFARRARLTGADAFARLAHELNNLGNRLRDSQERVAAQRELLDGALGALAEGVACINQLDRVVYANPAYRQFAAGGAEVVGQPYYRHLSADVVGLAVTALKMNKATVESPPMAGLRFEHRRRHLTAAVAVGGEGISVVVLHDRTELTRAEAARRDFLSAVSHELKTPLTAVIGYADTLLDGALDQPAVARSMVEGVARHGSRLLELVSDVLTLSRVEHGAWLVRPETIDWATLLRTVLDDHQAAAAAKPVTIIYEGPAHLPGRTDQELIRQLVGNLLSNAIRYNRADGKVWLRLVHDGQTVRISVQDTGIGIPVEHQHRVFERFYRVDSHRSRAVGGTGLGLAIVRHLAEVLGGQVTLVSNPEGSTFTAELPCEIKDQAGEIRQRTLGRA